MQLGKSQMNSWKTLNQNLWGGRRVLLTSVGIASCVILIRLTGLIQGWELTTLDQFFQVRPSEPTDQRIVIVAIDETDLRKSGKYPIPDAQMAKLLQALQMAKPRLIGLDIYRDLLVEPGHAELLKIYHNSPNLIGIYHVGDDEKPEIPPPPVLRDKGQFGFNNLIHDPDDKIRRGLLYWETRDHQKAVPSFALKLAIDYLRPEGLNPEAASGQKGALKLGKATFRRFEGHDGAYVLADDGGYQILLNLPGTGTTFQRVTMTQVLDGKVAPEIFRDRIVLIGYTAISLNDFAHTSYSGRLIGPPVAISDVEFHASVISQILYAAKDGRPLIHTWPDALEWLWIWVWSWMGARLSWKQRSLCSSGVAITLAGIFLLGISYGLFLLNGWLPVVPPLLAMNGSAIAILGYLARRQEELQRSKEFLSTIINTIPDPIFVKDRQHRWIALNEAFAKFLGYPLEDLLEKTDYDVFSEAEADIFHQQDEMVLKTEQEYQNEESLTDRQGITYQIETKRSLHKDAAGNLFLVGVIRDITQRKRVEDELKRTTAELVRSNAELQRSAKHLNHVAHHDSLTGLPNRKLFYARLEEALQWADKKERLVGLLFLDLDGFKQINDSMGHDVGDILLIAVARRLSRCLRTSDTVARLGGDEFTIILPNIPGSQDVVRVAEKILKTLAQEFLINGHTIRVTSSVGISIYPETAQDLESLVKEADNAMYRAKNLGKSRYELALTPMAIAEDHLRPLYEQ
jgi:diguanylate cyclase (GGDEF)-like protein/PAS domain S-box-containing protein